MEDLEFAFEPPSDEEIEYEDVSSVAEEHTRRSTTSIDDKISKLIQQRGHAEIIPEKDEVDEDDSSDSEPDRQEDFRPEDDDEVPTTAGGGNNRSFFAKADGVSFHANSFMDLHLSRPLLRACEALGYTIPTPIQAACIPLALTGRDICGSAITGSGKLSPVLTCCDSVFNLPHRTHL
ncbi:hypothetical protein QVD17_39418 [Tagetes erecta]|uniref:DEAD-box RNA helicase Q domain-containing protein n=1 Tax=Tagetes erecta TaxID=13708 RepID=A0AAD8NH43_TARER|nr:hypothetical protein QVD17_39418 [Tagetes erecta]